MTCAPCQKVRTALAAAGRQVAAGNFSAARAELPTIADGLAEKAEAVRVRARLALRRPFKPDRR